MLDQRFDISIEKKWQKKWEEEGLYNFNEHDSQQKIYSIDTPPPFTSGELHMGHVLSYSYIDFVARYKRMKGFNVYYPQGWDTQGFPTEVKVEKKFGRLKPAEFRQKCIEWTIEMIAKMKDQMKSMGFSPDWKHEYRTMDPEYHKKVQLSLIKMYHDKLIYRGKYPVFYCPRCVSAVAKSELEDEPKSGNLNYINFECEGHKLQIATTRPELMPAAVAVLFSPDDERYKKLNGKMIRTALGKEVPLIADKDVEKEFGTGLLMVCTYGDKMDVIWQNRHKLPIVEVLDQYGKMQNAGEFNGLKVEEARKKIIEKFEHEGKLVKKEPTNQTVKVHDRCRTPVELIASFQWFADIRTTAKQIKEIAHKIKWFPDFGISYLIDWVENAEWDWVISRQRVFGTPIPFYHCECGLTKTTDETDLPFVSEHAKEKKCNCGKIMKAETSTCDCWVDSSITPLIIAGYPDQNKMKKLYPASLRPQGVEIVRTWAFYTIYRSGVSLTHTPPFESILLNGNVLATDGKKMSKSLGNVISPADIMKDYPADAIRQWAALSGAMAKDRPFSFEDLKYAKSFLTKVWNAARFLETLGTPKTSEVTIMKTVDYWILGQLNKLIADCTEHMEKFEFHYAMSKIQKFFWNDFCDNYIEYVKYRIYSTDETEKNSAHQTLHKVVVDSLKLMAPFMPHIAEEINQSLEKNHDQKPLSIHKSVWPTSGINNSVYEKAAQKIEILNKIVSEVRQYKSKNRLAQNAEIETVRISLEDENMLLFDDEIKKELKYISKIKSVEVVKGDFGVSF